MVSLKLIFLIDNIEYRVSKTQNNKKKETCSNEFPIMHKYPIERKIKKNMTIKL